MLQSGFAGFHRADLFFEDFFRCKGWESRYADYFGPIKVYMAGERIDRVDPRRQGLYTCVDFGVVPAGLKVYNGRQCDSRKTVWLIGTRKRAAQIVRQDNPEITCRTFLLWIIPHAYVRYRR